jgi:hypothetical protein
MPLSSTPRPVDHPVEIARTPILTRTVEMPLAYPTDSPTQAVAYPMQNTSEAYPPPLPYAAPTLKYTASATLAPTSTLTFTPTGTLAPYTGKPFTIIFNNGNLWLAEIGGTLERQLTHEPEGWSIQHFDINRRGDKIAYVTLKRDPDIADGMIKQVDVRTGEVYPLIGMDDALIEQHLKWLDDTHLAFTYQHFSDYHIDTPTTPIPPSSYNPGYYSVFDLTSGKINNISQAVSISQSPDGRYFVTCISSYSYEPDCRFRLQDTATNQTQAVAEDTNFGQFQGWSADSQWMLFENATYGAQTDHKYLIVDPVSRLGTWVQMPGRACNATAWALQSAVVACSACENEQACQIHFWGPDGKQAKPSISLPKPFQILSWTPDDTRLLLFPEDHTLWIINTDGTGLQQIFGNVIHWSVLPNNGK